MNKEKYTKYPIVKVRTYLKKKIDLQLQSLVFLK